MNRLLFLLTIATLMSSCSSLVSFQTGRTIGTGHIGLQINGSVYGISDSGEKFTTPFLEVAGSYGILSRLDARLSVSSAINTMGSLKFQCIGNQNSSFALSLEPGLEYQLSNIYESGLIERYHFPIHISIHDQRNIAFYISPKYMLQNANEFTHFAGFSAGIAIDKNNTYYIGGGYFLPMSAGSGIQGQLFQLGAGMRFNFKPRVR